MRAAILVCLVGLVGAFPARAEVTVFTDQAAFLAAIGPNFYLETFDSTPVGGPADPIPYSANGFSYLADTADPGESGLFPFAIPNGNESDVIMSSNSGRDNVIFRLNSNNITAVGAFFFAADIGGNVIASDVIVDTDQTEPMVLSTGGDTMTFLGFVSDTPFESIQVIADSTLVVSFSCTNDLIVWGPVDTDADGVLDSQDNCVGTFNPRLGEMGEPERKSFQTTTGGQLDDDADGFGNQCDAKFGTAGQFVGGIDVAEHLSSFNKDRSGSDCGSGGDQPCAPFDLDNAGQFIGGSDLARTFQLFNQEPGPGCDDCPLACVGPACP